MSWKPERDQLSRPVYLALAEQLEKDIAAGCLTPGTKLPPQRELADFLDIHFTTVNRAYRLCELKGLISAVSKKRQISELLNYEYPTGMPHHKAAAVNWLQNIGVHTDTDHLAIVSGT